LKSRLQGCCAHVRQACSYSAALIIEALVVHLLLGWGTAGSRTWRCTGKTPWCFGCFIFCACRTCPL
jgi:hypothetical protein